MLLLCAIFRLKELFQVKNGLTTSLLFFPLENAKNLGRSDDPKRRKKEDGFTVISLNLYPVDNTIGFRLILVR